MAIKGLELFREKFKGYEDCYTVIGGAACNILFSEEAYDFRTTKDIDMIILLEDRYQEFAKLFWEFVREGGYRCGWKQSEDLHFYRFTEPENGYPEQIELFSRKPDYHLESDSQIIPIHIDEDVQSLSAILLNDDFYALMHQGRRVVNGICVLDAAYLIPFKAYAWLDLLKKKEAGFHVNEKDLKKHKYDVFRLLQIINVTERIRLSGLPLQAMMEFLSKVQKEHLRLEQIGLDFTMEEGLAGLRELYQIE